MENKREHQHPKPTKKQMKIVMAKIADYQKEQREVKENNIQSGAKEENTTFQK